VYYRVPGTNVREGSFLIAADGSAEKYALYFENGSPAKGGVKVKRSESV